jgi:hypothetical protein
MAMLGLIFYQKANRLLPIGLPQLVAATSIPKPKSVLDRTTNNIGCLDTHGTDAEGIPLFEES